MSGELREVLNYPNWMWIIGVLLLALVLVWVGVWLIRWLRSNRLQEQNQLALIPMDEKRRQRYLGLILRMLFPPVRTALKQTRRPMVKRLSSIPHSLWITRGRW